MMKTITTLIAATATLAAGALPTFAAADHRYDRFDRHEHRHEVRDQWKDLAITGGVVGLIGAATHNPGLAAVGAIGGLYSGVRYEEESPRGWRYDHDHRWDDRRREDRRDSRWDHRGW